MKKCRKIISAAVVIVLLLSCMGLPAFAADSETVRQYGEEGGFLAIGDSNFHGYGAYGYYHGQTENYSLRNVEGSAPYIIAQAIGCNCPDDIYDQSGNFWPLCHPGQTLGMTMDIYGIEDNLTDTAFDWGNYDVMIERFGYEGSFDGVRGESYNGTATVGSIIDLTERASLIAVQLGMCDVFYRALRISTSGGSFAGGFGIDTSDLEATAEFVETFLSTMYEGYNYWVEYYPVFIQKLQEINPDATIVIVGAYDMVADVELMDDSLVPIGSAVAAITASMNQHMQKWADEYGVLFADISNTETAAAQYDWSFLGEFLEDADVGTHPTAEGHAYIARQILSVLENQDTEPSTDVSVDLGRFQRVDFAMLDGKVVTDYTMDGYTITIPCNSKTASNLTVAIVGEDGTISVQTYQLTYDDDTGYAAYRIYGTNDAVKTVKKPVNNIISIFSKAATAIKGWFG